MKTLDLRLKHIVHGLALSGIVAGSAILAGCDKCSGGKSPTADTTGNTTTSGSTPVSKPDAASSTPPASEPTAASTSAATSDSASSTTTATSQAAAPSGDALQITDVKAGSGAEAVDGKKLSVHYTGTLVDGTKFDSSKDRGAPFSFVLGSGMVIPGWDQGLKGMKEGGVRKLTIPPALAYGNRAVGGVIPANSTLLFEIELVKVE